jgi:hypothetical protein
VLATAYDLTVFFRLVCVPPAEVTSADVLRFITAQRTGSDGRGLRVVADGAGRCAVACPACPGCSRICWLGAM